MTSERLAITSHYQTELDGLPETYKAALTQDVSPLKKAVAAASESSLIAVGSGGSFTVASLLCSLHEKYTGRVSRPSTPLELVCNPTLAASSPVFLISAEGKNPDIVEALCRARRNSARAVHILTNRAQSPLAETATQLTDIGRHVYEMSAKDGYLGTNSLLMNAVLVARTYQELDNRQALMPTSLAELRLQTMSVSAWLASANKFAEQASKRQTLIVVFSPHLRPVATDLESKLSESALINCQLADIRSFAHGRHLWLADRPSDCSVLALVDPSLEKLWNHMQSLFPVEVPTHTMAFAGAAPSDLLAGIVAQMNLVSAIARGVGRDPGRPTVPEFGRHIHYVELRDFIPPAPEEEHHCENSKHEVLGARWPLTRHEGPIRRALDAFRNAIQGRVYRSIVFDYDGVLCRSQQRDEPPSNAIVEAIVRLAKSGVIIGIASGRGGSVQEQLRKALPEELWAKIPLGLYNAGYIGDVSATPPKGATSEYLSHVTRIVRRLKSIGAPITDIRVTHPHQVSVRFEEGADANRNWFVIADALRHAGLDLLRVVRSKHSVDILGPDVCKSHLVAHIVQKERFDPYEVITIGDQGAWPGNDASLLDHRFSLSVDEPSRRLDRGWKLAPPHKRDVDATLWYLEHMQIDSKGGFKLVLPQSPEPLVL